MTELRTWKVEGPHHMRCAPWTICSATVAGREVFTLTRDGVDSAIGRDADYRTLQDLARDIERSEPTGAEPAA